jgi:hypothetical protein
MIININSWIFILKIGIIIIIKYKKNNHSYYNKNTQLITNYNVHKYS